MFITRASVVYCTKRSIIIIIGMSFLTFATFQFGLSLLSYFAYSDMAEKFSRAAYSLCDGCPLLMDAAISSSRFYGVVGGLFGAIGTGLTITGLKSKRIKHSNHDVLFCML